MSFEYDYLVFIGRFQPFHYGHASVMLEAFKRARHVIVLVGSSNNPRSWRNPFTFDERAKMIHDWYKVEGMNEIIKRCDRTGARQNIDTCGSPNCLRILPLDDYMYNDQGWITAVQQIVDTAVRTNERGWTDKPPKVGLIGHSKDQSSYYLSLFPQWGSVNVPAFTDRRLFNSTDVRTLYFEKKDTVYTDWSDLMEGIPKSTMEFLGEFHKTPEYEHLYDEHQYILKYRADHQYVVDVPYVATHTTVDAVVVQAGHVLLIERDTHPGKGLTAMPGGFINPMETLRDGMLRELREETKLKVPLPVLAGNIQDQKVFDDPHRSARGRILSHTFLITLPPTPQLPKVKGSSDAKRAWWQPLSSLNATEFFEDHWHIIHKMTGSL